MKTLLLALALSAALPSQAQEVFATSTNSGGGKMVLLSAKGICTGEQRAMFSALPAGDTIFGCWDWVAGFISVKYTDGALRMYDAKNWTLDPYYDKPAKPAKQTY